MHDIGNGVSFEVAKVYGTTPRHAEGNALLVAAAPELLSALRECLLALELGKEFQGEVLEVIATGLEAVNKATLAPLRSAKAGGAA
jgi:hypothetical protein